MEFTDCTTAPAGAEILRPAECAGLRMTRVVALRIGIVAVPADSVPLSSSLLRTYLRAIVWRPFGAGVGWATRGLRPADSRGRLSLNEFNVKIPALSRQTTGEGRGTPPKTLSEAKNLCTSLTAHGRRLRVGRSLGPLNARASG